MVFCSCPGGCAVLHVIFFLFLKKSNNFLQVIIKAGGDLLTRPAYFGDYFIFSHKSKS